MHFILKAYPFWPHFKCRIAVCGQQPWYQDRCRECRFPESSCMYLSICRAQDTTGHIVEIQKYLLNNFFKVIIQIRVGIINFFTLFFYLPMYLFFILPVLSRYIFLSPSDWNLRKKNEVIKEKDSKTKKVQNRIDFFKKQLQKGKAKCHQLFTALQFLNNYFNTVNILEHITECPLQL